MTLAAVCVVYSSFAWLFAVREKLMFTAETGVCKLISN